MIFKNILLFFFVFNLFFGKYLVFFCRSPFVSVQKKITSKKKTWLSLFSLVFFLLCSLSHLCHIFMFTLLAVSLLILHAFSLFFSSFFLFPCVPLLMFASRYVYLLSLSLLCFFCLFLQKKHLYWFFVHKKKLVHLFIPSCKTVFVLSPLLFRTFFSFVFSIVFFRTREIDTFFLLAEKQFV